MIGSWTLLVSVAIGDLDAAIIIDVSAKIWLLVVRVRHAYD